MRITFGVPEIMQFIFLYALVSFIWRMVSVKLGETVIGEAMSFIN